MQSIRAGMEKISPTCWSDWWWAPDNYVSSRLIHLGYHHISVRFGPHAALISTGYGWPGPTDRPDKSESVISAMRAAARYFRSPRLIFLSDEIEPWFYADTWIADGLNLDELQQRLAQIKEPSPHLRAAIRQSPESYEVDGYVIEELSYEAV